MLTSTLTSKGQATIPSEIKKKLDLHAGDKIIFEKIDNQVVIRKVTPFDYVYHAAMAATLTECGSPEDDEAYRMRLLSGKRYLPWI